MALSRKPRCLAGKIICHQWRIFQQAMFGFPMVLVEMVRSSKSHQTGAPHHAVPANLRTAQRPVPPAQRVLESLLDAALVGLFTYHFLRGGWGEVWGRSQIVREMLIRTQFAECLAISWQIPPDLIGLIKWTLTSIYLIKFLLGLRCTENLAHLAKRQLISTSKHGKKWIIVWHIVQTRLRSSFIAIKYQSLTIMSWVSENLRIFRDRCQMENLHTHICSLGKRSCTNYMITWMISHSMYVWLSAAKKMMRNPRMCIQLSNWNF